ncbi:MAG: tRNA (guanosine(46)-N7)-methyltransferase TrmB [Bacteroidota bacterium]
MSRRNKLQKFAEILAFPHVYENFNPKAPQLTGKDGAIVDLKGKWASAHFGNDRPITLELACGRGEYTLQLARKYPQRNFIGVDIKGARIWKGASMALAEGLHNVAFLRTRIEQVDLFFAPDEVSEIWITFPDPFLGKSNRRLTAPRFIERYRRFLRPDGLCHLKTDDPTLFEFSVATLRDLPGVDILYQDEDIYAKPLPTPELDFKTYYEALHLRDQKTIKYLRFRLSSIPTPEATL